MQLRHIHVPPESVKGAVIGAEFTNLRDQEGHVRIPVGPVTRQRRGKFMVASEVRIVRVMPIGNRVVKTKRYTASMARVGNRADDVTSVWRLHDVERGLSGIPEAEAVMVLRGYAQVFHAGCLHEVEPRVGIETDRIELILEQSVLVPRNNSSPLHLLVPSGNCIQAPVHEHPKPTRQEPVPAISERRHHARAPLSATTMIRTVGALSGLPVCTLRHP